MEHILNLIPNLDALTLTIATALATGLIAGLKALFGMARRLAARTSTKVDDTLINETEKALQERGKEI